MAHLLLSRDAFREGVFRRDGHKCVVCKEKAVDAHHILDRKLFPDGGYYLNNGVSLCERHHIDAEKSVITCEQLRILADITDPVLAPGLFKSKVYDKWGKLVITKHVKYPKTPHFPWSEKAMNDDRILEDVNCFDGREVVVSIKLDGENTSMYDDKTHARSINSDNHPSRDWVKGLWGGLSYQLPANWRICGENMYAVHTIEYEHLKTYFYVFSVWEENRCFSWDETLDVCRMLHLETVPVIYRGIFNREIIHNLFPEKYNGDPTEGYVVRLADSYTYEEFPRSIAKFVRGSFVIADRHWMQGKITPNKLEI
jgi:RNA ligase